MDIGTFILGIIAGIIIAVVAGVILLPIQRLWPSKGEKITEESFQHQLMLHKEQEFSEIEACLVVISIIIETLSGHIALAEKPTEEESEEFLSNKYGLSKCKKMVESLGKIISDHSLSAETNTRLRNAVEPLFYIVRLDRDVSVDEFMERYGETSRNLCDLVRELLEKRFESIEAN